MDRQIGTSQFLFLSEADTDGELEYAVDDETTSLCNTHPHQGANQL